MIRLFVYVCGFLVLANLLAYYWPDDSNRALHVYSAQKDLNPHFLRLNKEIEDKYLPQASYVKAIHKKRNTEQLHHVSYLHIVWL